ncbi:hypothetical protein WwAna0681, partial [Wolbachia endosymbiont of Drosophila ananassae]
MINSIMRSIPPANPIAGVCFPPTEDTK